MSLSISRAVSVAVLSLGSLTASTAFAVTATGKSYDVIFPRYEPLSSYTNHQIKCPQNGSNPNCGVVNRTYRYYIPGGGLTGSPTGRYPVVFYFHGGAGDANSAQAGVTERYLDALADGLGGNGGTDGYNGIGGDLSFGNTEKFIVVYPEGKPYPNNPARHSWNDCRGDYATTQSGYTNWDDAGFMQSLLVDLSMRLPMNAIDWKRLYFMGSSNGGMMVQRIALELANGNVASINNITPAAIAVNGANSPRNPEVSSGAFSTRCNLGPQVPVPALFIKGTLDTAMPFTSGLITDQYGNQDCADMYDQNGNCTKGRVKYFSETLQEWWGYNGTSTTSGYQYLWPNNPNAGGTYTDDDTLQQYAYSGDGPESCNQFPAGASNSRVRYLEYYDGAGRPMVVYNRVFCGGHQLPGPTGRASSHSGFKNQDIAGAKIMWDYVRQFVHP